MKTTKTHSRLPYCAVATEFSLRTDGRWLTVGGDHDAIYSDSFVEVAEWMGARTALNLGITMYADDLVVMSKSPGSRTIELCDASEGFHG